LIGPPYLHLRRHHAWQIELFFKELKSTLGMDRYRFQDFSSVEGWVRLCLLAFAYLEWYRADAGARPETSARERQRWRWQRSHGLCRAVCQDVEQEDLQILQELLQTPEGLEKARHMLHRAVQKEYRKAA